MAMYGPACSICRSNECPGCEEEEIVMEYNEATSRTLEIQPGIHLHMTFQEMDSWNEGGREWDVVSATLEAYGVALNLLDGFPFAPLPHFGEVRQWMEKRWPSHLMDAVEDCFQMGKEVKVSERKVA